MEEQAKEEVKKREKKKLDELLNKAKKEKEEKLAQAKRKAKKIAAEQKKADAHKANVSALESPTKNIQWKCITSGNHLHGSVNDVAIFEIKRGASTFELRIKNDDGTKEMREKMRKLGFGNIFTSPDVQRLKRKADWIFIKTSIQNNPPE